MSKTARSIYQMSKYLWIFTEALQDYSRHCDEDVGQYA